MTSYETIYSRFLAKIQDFELAQVDEDDFNEMLYNWLLVAIAKFTRCFVDLSNRDDDIGCFNIELSDNEIEVLALFMVCAWLEPQINSTLLTSQFFGGKEERFFAQANQLSELRALRESSLTEAKKLIRDESYVNNSYFE